MIKVLQQLSSLKGDTIKSLGFYRYNHDENKLLVIKTTKGLFARELKYGILNEDYEDYGDGDHEVYDTKVWQGRFDHLLKTSKQLRDSLKYDKILNEEEYNYYNEDYKKQQKEREKKAKEEAERKKYELFLELYAEYGTPAK